MTFKKTGSPVDIEVAKFGTSNIEAVACSKCGHPLGRKSAGMIEVSGSISVLTPDFNIMCPGCGEKQNV